MVPLGFHIAPSSGKQANRGTTRQTAFPLRDLSLRLVPYLRPKWLVGVSVFIALVYREVEIYARCKLRGVASLGLKNCAVGAGLGEVLSV